MSVTSLHLSDQLHGMPMTGKPVRASNIAVDFVGAALGEALHHGRPTGDVPA